MCSFQVSVCSQDGENVLLVSYTKTSRGGSSTPCPVLFCLSCPVLNCSVHHLSTLTCQLCHVYFISSPNHQYCSPNHWLYIRTHSFSTVYFAIRSPLICVPSLSKQVVADCDSCRDLHSNLTLLLSVFCSLCVVDSIELLTNVWLIFIWYCSSWFCVTLDFDFIEWSDPKMKLIVYLWIF